MVTQMLAEKVICADRIFTDVEDLKDVEYKVRNGFSEQCVTLVKGHIGQESLNL